MKWSLIVCMILVSASYSDALTTIRKEVKNGDKVTVTQSLKLKQLDLPEAEIDPNIGPTLPNAEEVVAEAVEALPEGNAEKPVAVAEEEAAPIV